MAPAVGALAGAAAGVAVSDPAVPLLSNADGKPVCSGRDWLERIIAQVSAPVRWDECMRTMGALGASAFIELPPAGTLAGLARRALPGVRVLALKSPGDLAEAQALAAEHAPPVSGEDTHAPDWRLLVSPLAGTFHASADGQRVPAGARVDAGARLGEVRARSGQHPLHPPFAATVLEWLVEDGDPVDTGQALVRLQPESTQ
jgi:[acyl-carrier-protein] S-malonyltransferase